MMWKRRTNVSNHYIYGRIDENFTHKLLGLHDTVQSHFKLKAAAFQVKRRYFSKS